MLKILALAAFLGTSCASYEPVLVANHGNNASIVHCTRLPFGGSIQVRYCNEALAV